MGRDSEQTGLPGDIVCPTAQEEPWEGPSEWFGLGPATTCLVTPVFPVTLGSYKMSLGRLQRGLHVPQGAFSSGPMKVP